MSSNNHGRTYHAFLTVRYRASNLFTEEDFNSLCSPHDITPEEFALEIINEVGFHDAVDGEGEILDIVVCSDPPYPTKY